MALKPLEVKEHCKGIGARAIRVSGFTEDEMYDLLHMDYRDMKETLIRELDERNNGLGTKLHKEYGVLCAYENQGFNDSLFLVVGDDSNDE